MLQDWRQLRLHEVLQDLGLQLLGVDRWLGLMHEVVHPWSERDMLDARFDRSFEAGSRGAWHNALLLHILHGRHRQHEEVLRLELVADKPLPWRKPFWLRGVQGLQRR